MIIIILFLRFHKVNINKRLVKIRELKSNQMPRKSQTDLSGCRKCVKVFFDRFGVNNVIIAALLLIILLISSINKIFIIIKFL